MQKNRYYRTYGPYAFDALIALGLVIRDTFYQVNWMHMDYLNHTAGSIFKAAFRKLQFQGLTVSMDKAYTVPFLYQMIIINSKLV